MSLFKLLDLGTSNILIIFHHHYVLLLSPGFWFMVHVVVRFSLEFLKLMNQLSNCLLICASGVFKKAERCYRKSAL